LGQDAGGSCDSGEEEVVVAHEEEEKERILHST
jgi:hypothetical protein